MVNNSKQIKYDMVRVGIKFEAIVAVDLPNGMKAGDHFNMEGKSIFKFRNGKLWRIADYS
jgi:ketosteroid isomerase-like protein